MRTASKILTETGDSAERSHSQRCHREAVLGVMAAESLGRTQIVCVDRIGEATSRRGGLPRTHVVVRLPRATRPLLVVPEVDVLSAFHRLDPEATSDLHGIVMQLPLLKGNSRVGERCLS